MDRVPVGPCAKNRYRKMPSVGQADDADIVGHVAERPGFVREQHAFGQAGLDALRSRNRAGHGIEQHGSALWGKRPAAIDRAQ